MGVFKEFLEEVITKAFDPDLNLFKVRFRILTKSAMMILFDLSD
jgi:hypothetical protein